MFVGRVAELTALAEAAEQGGLAEVVGEPGIGKTRLLTEFARRAEKRGLTVLRGRATEYEREMPYRAFEEAFDPLPDGDRLVLARQVRGRLAAAAPAVLILDDLHWADPGSIELLGYLIRRPLTAGPVLLVCAYRGRQGGVRLPAALAEAGPAAVPHTRIEVPPLALTDAEALIGNRPGLRALYAESNGNPLYLEALAAQEDRGSGDRHDLAGLLLGEIAQLSATELLVAQSAAVLGDEFTPDDIAMVLDSPHTEALGRLASRDLIRPDGGRFRFRHPLLRRLIYEKADPAWRMGAHRVAARELTLLGAPVREVAHHVSRTASRHDPADLRTLMNAAKDAVMTAPAAAIEWLTAALPLVGDLTDPASVELRVLLARAYTFDGRLEAARAAMHELLPHLPVGTRGAVVAACAVVERLLGRYQEAASLLSAEVSQGGQGAWLHRELATLRLQMGDVGGALAEVAEAIAAADSPEEEAGAHSLLAFTAAYEGNPQAAGEAIAEAAALADGLSDAEAMRELTCLTRLSWAELFMERYADAERHVRRALTLARPLGRSGILADVLTAASQICGHPGRLAEAIAFGQEAEDVAHQSGSPTLLALVQAIHAESLAYLDLTKAVHLATRASESVAGVEGWWSATTVCLSAQVLLAAGEPDRARWMLLGIGGGVGMPQCQPGYRPMWLETLTQAALGCDEVAWASAAANAALAAADALGLPAQRAFALRAQSCVRAAEGDQHSAEAFAEQAIGLFGDAAMRPQVARTLLMTAACRTDPHHALATAKSIALDIGATVIAEEAEREQRRLAARGPRRGELLTKRERQIAELAMTGMTSKEIATKLMLSSRTVDDHLARVYRKLGVSSRAALAGVLH
ncbi:LuxR family transcriptional regulator [Acrocarpospora phusangensis]|uniref:LuxR family transcriptional regulator n=1 Tax=Acrocarpospora phusangensis TaxID=1070424 RepID=A0A919QCF6_9ACTN|nr:LuxR family transcriptional regulator [Acrocarpospora phusangensis]GIH26123.1 LuxR family transcriptional regulator [Acrocarpospora phusangensis]